MLLNEILNSTPRISKRSNDIDLNDKSTDFNAMASEHRLVTNHYAIKSPQSSSNILGKGAEAIVFQSKRPQDAGVVTKWIRNQVNDAKNNEVVQFLVKSQQLNNTYMPRVYSITQHNLTNGMYEFVVKMEKLSFTLQDYAERPQVDGDVLLEMQILTQFINEQESEHMLIKNGRNPRGEARDIYKKQTPFEKVVNWVCNSLHMYKANGDLNANFEKAYNFVMSFDADNDLHTENYMIRLTSTGPQLVIMDPFVDSAKWNR